MNFALHPEPQQPNQCRTFWAPNQNAVKYATYNPRNSRQSHHRMVDLTQCFSRHQISEPKLQTQPHPPQEARPIFAETLQPSYFNISRAETPAISPLSRVPAVQQTFVQRESRSPSPEWAVPYARPANARALRDHRIRNARLMTDDKHKREVAALVERMVDERSQCEVHVRTSSATSSSSSSAVASPMSSAFTSPLTSSTSLSSLADVIDETCEDVDMDPGMESDSAVDYPSDSKNLKFRRSGDMSVMPAVIVKKDIRIRKRIRAKSRASGGSGRPWEI